MTQASSISILIPCFNEEECLPALFSRFVCIVQELKDCTWNIILVNDGSSDDTEKVAVRCLEANSHWCSGVAINFSRNFGKESALLAGLDHFDQDACIIIDADLQDPPELIPQLIERWRAGADIVSATRESRDKDGFLKNITARHFYKLFRATSKLNILQDASDFRLLDKRVVEAIRSCRETVRFSKGFFAWAGFNHECVYFRRPKRHAGFTKWGSWKLWNYALDGIFNYSTAPLRIWSYIGLVITLASFFLALRTVLSAMHSGIQVPGYASIFTAVTFLGGVQLIGIGILGEYLGRTYLESKRRPSYIIRSITNFNSRMNSQS